MNALLDFRGQKVRHVVIDDNPWFVAIDVCRCLGMSVERGSNKYMCHIKGAERWLLSKRQALADHRLDRGAVHGLFNGNSRGPMTLVSESGLYKLIMRSDKPVAATFQDWVTQEVLPSIRRTGAYITPQAAQETLPPPVRFSEGYSVSVGNAAANLAGTPPSWL